MFDLGSVFIAIVRLLWNALVAYASTSQGATELTAILALVENDVATAVGQTPVSTTAKAATPTTKYGG